MNLVGWIQIAAFSLVVLALTRPVGAYLFRVFEGDLRPLPRILGPVERGVLRLCGVDPSEEQDWKGYATALLVFSGMGILVTYAILRLQALLPGNPNGLSAVGPDLALTGLSVLYVAGCDRL